MIQRFIELGVAKMEDFFKYHALGKLTTPLTQEPRNA